MDEEPRGQGRSRRRPLHRRRHPGARRVPGDPLRARPLLRHPGLSSRAPAALRALARRVRAQPRRASARIRPAVRFLVGFRRLPAKARLRPADTPRQWLDATHTLGGRAAVITAPSSSRSAAAASASPSAPPPIATSRLPARRRLEPQDRAVAAARARRQRRGGAAHAGLRRGLGQRRRSRGAPAAARSCARSSTRFSPSSAARRRARSRPGSRTWRRTTTSPTARSIAGRRSRRRSGATATTATASSCSASTCCAISASAEDEVYRAIVFRRSDGQHHMVTFWFEHPDDPWVIDPTGAMTSGMPRMSEMPGLGADQGLQRRSATSTSCRGPTEQHAAAR